MLYQTFPIDKCPFPRVEKYFYDQLDLKLNTKEEEEKNLEKKRERTKKCMCTLFAKKKVKITMKVWFSSNAYDETEVFY